ncbi:uncharacterized protein LOC123307242 [Coccinella septempunctata]|uniref:uncharacterized protein LOC123307242 n=1 Tax=Coccinella septempunctata TaxID=41139 RepID=UPI001D089237|nr:uncharacterized protein LOC123307242 [Coccinella septempunctata]
MRTLFLLAFLVTIISVQTASSKKCSTNPAKIECTATEYQNYVDCIRSRMKRSADCYEDDEEECPSGDCGNSCDNCNCDECTSSNCGNSCNRRCCSSCCEFKECSTNHCCHRLCHNSCSTSSCRSSCRRSCYKSVRREKERDIIIPGGDRSSTNSSNLVNNRGTHNITTVIHLNNLINNTNLIDVPINLNNSNVNNITVENSQNGSSVYGASSNSPCCNVVEPRQCVPTASYPYIDCFHLRRQQCGQFCRAPVVHKVAQNVCYNSANNTPVCGQQVIYVPQPRTSCSYQPQWPFVACNNQGGDCNGCYDYLLNPFRTQRSCGSSCYNYGVNQGMMFRQGPVFGPGYSLPPMVNPMMPTGCNSYSGCGLTNMATYINPGMYYGANTYNNYGIYGSFTPQGIPGYDPNYGMQLQGYGGNLMAALTGGANMGNIPLPLEQFVPMNLTANATNVLYGLITNQTSPLTPISGLPDNMFGQAITIDEETFKKLLGQDISNGVITPNEDKTISNNKESEVEVARVTENEPTTTTYSSLVFGR